MFGEKVTLFFRDLLLSITNLYVYFVALLYAVNSCRNDILKTVTSLNIQTLIILRKILVANLRFPNFYDGHATKTSPPWRV